MRSARLGGLCAALAVTTAPWLARADGDPPVIGVSEASTTYSLDRPHTLVDVGLGALTVPRGNLCITSTCTTTDLTLLLALRHFYKWNRRWGLGAGISWGLRPGSEDATVPTNDGLAVSRTHARNYFSIAASARYYPISEDRFDFWTGLTSGVVIVSDRYATVDKMSTSIVGPTAVTVATEGFMVGVGLGVDWTVARNWSVGVWTTPMLWTFPKTPNCAQTNECSSATGNLFSFETGLSVTYRVRL